LFQLFFDQIAVPAGSITVSPSLAPSIAAPTTSGVKAAAVRVSARTLLGNKPPAATSQHGANIRRNCVLLKFIAIFKTRIPR
jgi:hypothetical protein